MITLRDPRRPLIAGLVLVIASWLTGGTGFPSIARLLTGSGERALARLAVAASMAVLVFSIAWTSRAAGGSDSSCYVLQAEAFAHGEAVLRNPVAAVLPGAPNAVFAPAGFLPSPREFGAAVPICAPGLSMAMALVYRVHPAAVFLVVPISAACLVWLTFLYGRRVDSAVTGACAAVLVACSPVFLYQAVQPMSDVPAAAAWLAALVSASPLGAGVWASIAVLIRPNLALLALLLVWLHPRRAFAIGAAPGLIALLVLNAVRYGAPLTTGYGDTEALFTRAHVAANLLRYPLWLLETQSALPVLAIAAPFVLRRDRAHARLAWISLAAVALLFATYLAYTVFDDWWYIRFLLPALPILIALSVAVLRSLAAWLPSPAGGPALATLTVIVAGWSLHVALDRHVTGLQALESRFAMAGAFAARELPSTAVVIAGQQTGSVRFHGRRDTIAWDAIAADALDATIARLRAAGRVPIVMLEETEEPRFRSRFHGQRAGALDTPPSSTMHAPVLVHVYVPPS